MVDQFHFNEKGLVIHSILIDILFWRVQSNMEALVSAKTPLILSSSIFPVLIHLTLAIWLSPQMLFTLRFVSLASEFNLQAYE